MRIKVKLTLAFVALACFGVALSAALVSAAPPPPSSFYGTVKVNGANAPTWVTIQAKIGGVAYYSGTPVQISGADAVYALDVPGDVPEIAGKQGGAEGETIQFYIGGLLCAQTGIWHNGSQVNLNLTASGTLPTVTPTNTTIPTSTSTRTPTPSLTPTRTNTPAATPTPMVTEFAPGGDTFLDSITPTANRGSDQRLKVRTVTGINYRTLIYFDLSSLPTNANIQQATLNLRLDSYDYQSNLPANVSVYKVLPDWAENTATWNQRLDSIAWGAAGCEGVGDRSTSVSGVAAISTINTWYAWNITSLVQDWVTSPSGNKGMILISDGSRELRFYSNHLSNPQQYRPYLHVEYAVGGGPAPTTTVSPTPSQTPVVNPTPQTFSASQDVEIRNAEPTRNLENMGLRVQGQGFKRSLLNFNVSSIPVGSQILSATLRLTASDYNDGKPNMALNVGAYPVNRAWVASQATWQNATTGTAWGMAGCDAVPGDRDGAVASTTVVQAISTVYEWDVRSIVQGWVNNPAGQAGLVLLAQDANFRDVGFYDSAYRNESQRPVLYVTWRPGVLEPTPTSTSTPIVTPSATVTPGQGTVQGIVFNDLNGNGSRDSGELGVMGATVQLSQGGLVKGEFVTSGSGTFDFGSRAPGTYSLQVTPPSGYISTGQNPRTIIVSPGLPTEVNMGVRQPPAILSAYLPYITK